MNEGLYLQGMSLLDFARGPAFRWAVAIFVLGVVWRLTALLLASPRRLEPARGSAVSGGVKTLLTRSVPAHELEKNILFQHYSGYAWHISLFIVVLLFAPHMMFFKSLLGFGWPTLPTVFITFFTVVTMSILLVLMARRLINPVLRQISTTDDYVSWLIAFLPLLTGIMAFTHVTFGMRYETVLALHILSVCLLLVWFPFGKLMHALYIWPSRYKVGAAFARRGVRA
jgi:nitrate reductase gamma subunit